MTHRWSGWPGAFCLDCGNYDGIEDAVACTDCDLKLHPNDPASDTMCELHTLWAKAMETCPPDAELVKEVNAAMAAQEDTS